MKRRRSHTDKEVFYPAILVKPSSVATALPIALSRYHAFAEKRWDAIMAAASVVALPIFLLYLVIQRQFVESMTMTGLKG